MNRAMVLFQLTTEFPHRDITEEDTRELYVTVQETLQKANYFHLMETVEFNLSKTEDNKVQLLVGVTLQ